jgi:hypothetical protein
VHSAGPEKADHGGFTGEPDATEHLGHNSLGEWNQWVGIMAGPCLQGAGRRLVGSDMNDPQEDGQFMTGRRRHEVEILCIRRVVHVRVPVRMCPLLSLIVRLDTSRRPVLSTDRCRLAASWAQAVRSSTGHRASEVAWIHTGEATRSRYLLRGRQASGIPRAAATGEGVCHDYVPKHADRGPTSTAATATIRAARGHPLRHTPDTPLGRCCNTDPAKHYPGSGSS